MLKHAIREPRRILMTLDAAGGVWQYAVSLAEQLAGAGVSVVLAGLGPHPSARQRDQAEQFATLTWLQTPPDWLADGPEDLAGLSRELGHLVRDHAIDLVHLNAPAQAASLSLACPVVVVAHSCVPTWFMAVKGSPPTGDWAWHREWNGRGFEQADVVIAPSAGHAAAIQASYGPLPHLMTVHNAVPTVLPGESRRRPTVFAAGRWWDEGKNGRVLDEAAALSGWPVSMAGPLSGPNGQQISFNHATPLGPMSNAETRSMMAACGIFVSPSIYEPFGLAALEAAIAGAPLLLSDIPTYREIWEGAALFFPSGDSAALAAAIDELAADPAQRRHLGSAARHRSARYTTASQLAATRIAYAEAAAIHAGRS